MKIINSDGLNLKMLQDALDLDAVVYPKYWQDTYETAYARFLVFPNYLINAYDEDDNLLGYLCYVPITDKLYNEMLQANHLYDDEELKPEELDLNSSHWFIFSICVYPNAQCKGLGSKLVDTLIHSRPAHVKDITAFCCTENGFCLLSKYGFKALNKVSTGEIFVRKMFI